jgi:aromatic ring-opening dioxygenase catalytic subunit (LigB family)
MGDRRMPVLFIPHGGGPWPFVELSVCTREEVDALAGFLRGLPEELGLAPKALLVVSAHWEERVATVMSSPRPPLLYDYYGFPPEAYEIQWPAPGDPALARRVRELLAAGGFDSAADAERGFDHGTFIPLKVMYPRANVPTVQLSILRSLSPSEHMAIGQGLAPLRDEGILIVGSGMSYHDLPSLMRRSGRVASEEFGAWLDEAATAEPQTRTERLREWTSAPRARQAHPREDHLLPLMVAAGAAGSDRGRRAFNGLFGDARISAFRYG